MVLTGLAMSLAELASSVAEGVATAPAGVDTAFAGTAASLAGLTISRADVASASEAESLVDGVPSRVGSAALADEANEAQANVPIRKLAKAGFMRNESRIVIVTFPKCPKSIFKTVCTVFVLNLC